MVKNSENRLGELRYGAIKWPTKRRDEVCLGEVRYGEKRG